MSTSTIITDFRMQVWRNSSVPGAELRPEGLDRATSSLNNVDDQVQGNFVPLEVNFRFKIATGRGDRRYDHITDLMELFEVIFPSKIDEFFLARQQHSTTHHMVLVPFGNKLAKETVHRNTRVKILRSLEVRSSTVVERNRITPIDMCNLALEVVRGSAVGADVATMVRTLPAKWVTGASMVQEYDRLRKLIQATQAEPSNGPLKTIEDVTDAWNKAEPCLDLMSTIIRHIEDCLDLSSVSKNKEIPPQQLYETMLGLRNANIFFSAYEGQMLKIAEATPALMNPSQGAKIVVGAATAAAVIAAAAALLVYTFFTGGTGFIVAGGASGAVLGGGATAGIGGWKRNKHASICENFSKSIVRLGIALTEANVALAATYSRQVLQLPLNSPHWVSSQRDGILRELGVDTQHLNKAAYQDQVVEERLGVVLQRYSEFVTAREKVEKAAGVRTRRELAPKLPTAQGLQIRSSPRAQSPVISPQQAVGSMSTRHQQPQQQPPQHQQARSLPAAPSRGTSTFPQPRSMPIQSKNPTPTQQSQQQRVRPLPIMQGQAKQRAPTGPAPVMQSSPS
ncbi:hypothetical protein B0T21DRAFT_451425 [Apiosordaria backusii]|uniref:Transmembrane protein n=1 Tax=Apiosordaria backusii TaxID=314023 RepID=A0AA40BM37_9PEZI|nr:hypothetical protein B0T21DRAFT_451425 [Apiosordaria backusii]